MSKQQIIEAEVGGQVQIANGSYKGRLAIIEDMDDDKLNVRVLDHGEGEKATVKLRDVTVLRAPDADAAPTKKRATKKRAK